MHRLGGTAGMFWAALHRFTRAQSVRPVHVNASLEMPDLKMPDLDNTAGIEAQRDSHVLPFDSLLPQRTRRQTEQHPDYVDSSDIVITSSSPVPSSHLTSSFASDNVGHVSREEHTARAVSEDATVQLASALLRHALIHSPLHHVATIGDPSPLLLKFSGVRRRMFGRFVDEALELEATADGEITLLRWHSTGCFVDYGEVLALLEAKKRFELVYEGRPVVTDSVLGQTTGEALALRLSLAATELGHGKELVSCGLLFPLVYSHVLAHSYLYRREDPFPSSDWKGTSINTCLAYSISTVIIVLATRQYLCFLSFPIPDTYVEKVLFPSGLGFQNDDMYYDGDSEPESEDDDTEDDSMDQSGEDEEEEEVITVRATDWLDLGTERCRQLACDNIAALVGWQLKSRERTQPAEAPVG